MKIGVVGLGSIGSRHAKNLRSLGHEVIGYDPAHKSDVRFERMVYEQADAVVIATPSLFHVGPLRAAVERRKHALVEKPISSASPEAIQPLLDLAFADNLVVMTGNNLRFHPCVKQAKQWIDQQMIGDPLWASFTCAQLNDKPAYLRDGVLLNWGSHEIDLALYLLGPAKVLTASVHAENGCDDIADIVLEHENGARSTIHLDYITPNEIREAWICGTEKNIGLDLVGRRASMGRFVQEFDGSYDTDYLAEMQAFIDRIEGKESLGATGFDGLATLRVCLDARKLAGLS